MLGLLLQGWMKTCFRLFVQCCWMRNNSATGIFILVKGNFHDVESDVMEVEKWCLD